jgi:hypothetical protein
MDRDDTVVTPITKTQAALRPGGILSALQEAALGADSVEHSDGMRRRAVSRDRARTVQVWAIAVGVVGLTVEVVVILPLLLWGLANGWWWA